MLGLLDMIGRGEIKYKRWTKIRTGYDDFSCQDWKIPTYRRLNNNIPTRIRSASNYNESHSEI